jgi:hypothetical protein
MRGYNMMKQGYGEEFAISMRPRSINLMTSTRECTGMMYCIATMLHLVINCGI